MCPLDTGKPKIFIMVFAIVQSIDVPVVEKYTMVVLVASFAWSENSVIPLVSCTFQRPIGLFISTSEYNPVSNSGVYVTTIVYIAEYVI